MSHELFFTQLLHDSAENVFVVEINPLNAELNPVCHLLALLGAHLIFHVSRIRVKPLFLISVVSFS